MSGSNTIDNSNSGNRFNRQRRRGLQRGRIASNNRPSSSRVSSRVSSSVFPNPAKNTLTIDLSNFLEKTVDIQLISIEGQVLQHIELPNDHSTFTYQMDIGQIANGLYQVYLSSKESNERVRLPLVIAK